MDRIELSDVIFNRCGREAIAVFGKKGDTVGPGWVYGVDNCNEIYDAWYNGDLPIKEVTTRTAEGVEYTIYNIDRIGIVPHRDGMVSFFVVDYDNHGGGSNVAELARKYALFFGAQPITFTSKSGNGIHQFYLLETPIPVLQFCQIMRSWNFNKEGYPEVFPKTSKLTQVWLPNDPNTNGGDTYISGTESSCVIKKLPPCIAASLTDAAKDFFCGLPEKGTRHKNVFAAAMSCGESGLDKELCLEMAERALYLCDCDVRKELKNFSESYDKGFEKYVPEKDPVQLLPILADNPHFEILGYSLTCGLKIIYRRKDVHEIIEIPHEKHVKNFLNAIAPIDYWKLFANEKGTVDYTSIQSALTEIAYKIGPYYKENERGYGLWEDEGRLAYNDGETINGNHFSAFKTKYHYLRNKKVSNTFEPKKDRGFFNVFDSIGFSEGDKILFSGWVAIAPLCGALSWRPHIWVTAEHGRGKSTLLDKIVKPLLGHCVFTSGNSSEAGIRQRVQKSAIPIVLDEAEGNNENSKRAMERIIELARKSSGNNSGSTLKGTPGGNAMSFSYSNCFCFASINPVLPSAADETRICELIYNGTPPDVWREIAKTISSVFTEKTCGEFRAWYIKNFDTIKESIKIIHETICDSERDARLSDQYAPLIAGYWHISNDHIIDGMSSEMLFDRIYTSEKRKEKEFTSILAAERVLSDIGDMLIGPTGNTTSIRKLISNIVSYSSDSGSSRELLNKYGINISQNNENIMIDLTNAEFNLMIKKYGWVNQLKSLFKRDPKIEMSYPTTICGKRVRAAKMSVEMIVEEKIIINENLQF